MMTHFLFFISWTPILLVFILVIGFRAQAITLAIWGLGYTILLVLFIFKTAPGVIFLASLDGVLITGPLLLVIYCGILLSVFLLEKGALQRLARWLSAGSLSRIKKSLLLSVGVGNFMEGAGIIAEPVAAPMLLASGIDPKASAALSIMGYSGLMHLSLAGVIVTVLASVTGIPAGALVWDLGILSFPATILLCFAIPRIIKAPLHLKENLFALLFSGILAASVALISAEYIGYSVSGMLAGIAVIIFFYLLARQFPPRTLLRGRDLIPFLFIFVCLALVNLVPPIRQISFYRLVISVDLIPHHTIRLRPLFDAYLYLFAAFLMAFLLYAGKDERFLAFFKKANKRGMKAVVAVALFGAMGQIIAYSGYGSRFATFDQNHNIAICLAQGVVAYTGRLYPLFVPFLGWIGTFLTGYGVASIMLFGKLQMETASMMGIPASFLVCSLTVGASIGSVSSPFKIAIAAPLCGAEGQEGEILRRTIPLGIGVSFCIGLFALLWLHF
jgi:lactate permease